MKKRKKKEWKMSKSDEAIGIIRTKNVDEDLIKKCYGPFAYTIYNSHIDNKDDELTEKEYELVKEWLEE